MQKGGLCPLRLLPLMTEFSVFCFGHSTRKHLSTGRFSEGLQNHMENKNGGNENEIILGHFNCTMDKKEKDGRNKTLYKCQTL